MEELKGVTVLFKRSIVEHFGEALLKSLCNLNSSDDYQNLDTSLVYNLLRNVCKQITPPTRGWGYEPSADDVSLGADIERIRSIWNTFCDGETEVLYLKDIFVRMVDRYGNISDDIKFEYTRRKKILTFELNPECQEEDGVVLTKAIQTVLEILGKENCVVLKGTVGTGKSTCLKYIDRHYRRNHWEVGRKEGSITQSDFYVGEKRKLLCCDNIFGVYNRGNFAGTDEIIKTLENIEQKVNQELKVVLAIHDHVYEELLKSNVIIKVFQNKRVVVDFNELSGAETLLIFNNQRKNGHCKKHPKCWFQNIEFESLKDTLNENPGNIGDPILTLLYSNHHDIFAKKETTQNIVKELCTIFQSMLEKTPDLFHVLLYVMFVESYSFDNNVTKWAHELGGLKSETVEKKVCHLDAFVDVQAETQISMKHELLSFALFKFCANHPKYMPLLLKHCQFQMIEEIIRPLSVSNKSEFCVILNTEMYPNLISRIKREKLIERLKLHPLIDKNSPFRYIFYSKMKTDVSLMREAIAYNKKNCKDEPSTKDEKST